MIIGLAGRMASGKGMLASLLIKNGFIKISFASALKEALSILYSCPINYFIDRKFKDSELVTPIYYNNNTHEELSKILKIDDNYKWKSLLKCEISLKSRRELLQFVGSLLRQYDNDFHIKNTIKTLDVNKNYIFDDIRFKNELFALKNIGAKCFFILKPDNLEISNDVSETSVFWKDFEFIILNTKSKNKIKSDFIKFIESEFIENIETIEKFENNKKFIQNRNAFLEIDENSAYYAGVISRCGTLHKNKKNTTINFNCNKSLRTKLREFLCVKSINTKINSPYIIENIKYWNLLCLDKYPLPDFILKNNKLFFSWLNGVYDTKELYE